VPMVVPGPTELGCCVVVGAVGTIRPVSLAQWSLRDGGDPFGDTGSISVGWLAITPTSGTLSQTRRLED
jgi:hypothetical protein